MDLTGQISSRFEESYKKGKTPWVWPDVSASIVKFADMAAKDFPGGNLLDIGCGSGWLSVFFAEKGFKVEGIDSAPTAIEEANRKKEEEKLDNLNFFVGNALDYPYEKEKYDIVFDRGLFHHIPEENWENYKNVVLKTLKKGGLFFLAVFSYRVAEDFLKPEEISQMWRKRQDQDGGLSYDHFFDKNLIEKIFADNFEMIEIDDDNEDKSKEGLRLLYVVMRKK